MYVQMIIAFIAAVFLAGCATTRQPSEVNQLQIKVSQLERKLDDKDQEINDLKYQINEISSKSENTKPGKFQSIVKGSFSRSISFLC